MIRIGRFLIELPKKNIWTLTKDCKWNYKSIRISYFSKEFIFRLNTKVWAQYNKNWKETQAVVNKHTSPSNIPQFKKKQYELGPVECSVTFLPPKKTL